MTPRTIRITIGAIIWLGIIAFVGVRYVPSWFGDESNSYRSLSKFMLGKRDRIEISFSKIRVCRIGDPVYWENEEGRLIQIGMLRQVDTTDSTEHREVLCDWASVVLFASAPEIQEGDYLAYHVTPDSMDWVAKFLFPAERQKEIAKLVTQVYTEHSEEVLEELMPILQDAWAETSVIIRDELLESVARHQGDFEILGKKYRTEIIEAELSPLLNEEVWPLIREQAQPLLEEVGQQIWKEASVFRFGWRALYDASPLPDRDLTVAEFSRFVEQEAGPILAKNMPKFIDAQKAIVEKTLSNPRVRQFALDSFKKISQDPEVHQLLLKILKESIFENPKLLQALENTWQRPDLQSVMRMTDAKLAPTVETIGELTFGSPYDGVTPEFARILRNKILLKDSRWFVLKKANGDPTKRIMPTNKGYPDSMAVVLGDAIMDNPFYYPASER